MKQSFSGEGKSNVSQHAAENDVYDDTSFELGKNVKIYSYNKQCCNFHMIIIHEWPISWPNLANK